MKTKMIAIQAVFLALALILHFIENLLVPPLPLPGAKLGLANIIPLVLIYLYSWKEGLLNSIFRVFLGSIIVGTFFTPAFFFSIAGAILSTIAMSVVIARFRELFSIIGVGIIGAVGHNLAQLFVAILITSHLGVLLLSPLLIIISIITGMTTGYIASITLKSLFQYNVQRVYQNIY